MKYWISLIATALCLSIGWAKPDSTGVQGGKGQQNMEQPGEKGGKGKAYGLDEEFKNNMPEEVRTRVEALKAIAAEMRAAYKALEDLDPEAAKAKREEIRTAAKTKRAAILETLSPEEKGKVEKILEDVDKENQGKGEQMRNRQRAIRVLKEKVGENPDHKGHTNALNHVEKGGKPEK